jgi:hypothetical protein
MAPSTDRSPGTGWLTAGSCMAISAEGWGASGKSLNCVGDGVVDGGGCCAERGGRPRKRVASRRAPLRTLLVINLYRPHVPESRIRQGERPRYWLGCQSPITDKQQAPAITGVARNCFTGADREQARAAYSRPRTLSRMGNLRATVGKNSNTRFPPASVAMDVRKVRLTTLAVTLGSG